MGISGLRSTALPGRFGGFEDVTFMALSSSEGVPTLAHRETLAEDGEAQTYIKKKTPSGRPHAASSDVFGPCFLSW